MIIVNATVMCDRYHCQEKVQVEYELTTDERNIPELTLVKNPEGWDIQMNEQYYCMCPAHNYMHKK